MNVLEFNYAKPDRRPKLKDQHTRQLMEMLRVGRACGGTFEWSHGVYFSTDEIKVELNTREHVPNKFEAQIIRQELAKTKRNR